MKKFIVVHDFENQNYEDGGYEIYGQLFDTKEEAQFVIDYELAKVYNDLLDDGGRSGLRISKFTDSIIVHDDWGAEMDFDYWYIVPVYGK